MYRVFDYAIPDNEKVEPGVRFRLPFGSGSKTGLLLEARDAGHVQLDKVKTALDCLDESPVMSGHLLKLAHWMASYYLQPLGEVVFQCLPRYLRKPNAEKPLRIKVWRALTCDPESRQKIQRRSPRQDEILSALEQSKNGLNAAQLKKVNERWSNQVRALEAKSLVEWQWAKPAKLDFDRLTPPELNSEQSQVLQDMASAKSGFSVHLLDGITGSGKTEVYFRLIQECIANAQQIIYLVPEIGLTSQLVNRIKARFGDDFAISHSALSETIRYQAWDRFRRAEVNIMLGTRSSLFSQSERLGLIIIDEEHDLSYRQQDGIRYHARDVAIKRAQMLDIPILLGSATPSLESLHNCTRAHYVLHRLTTRPTRFEPPDIELIDIRNVKLKHGCSPELFNKVGQHLARRGQVLLYLNRRGFAPVVMCHECGWQGECKHCDARLTLHQSLNRLLCHHCGYGQALPQACPSCDHSDIKHYGIGTEQLEQGLRQHYPDTLILRIDRDVISTREGLSKKLEQLDGGEPCILIGTQMIAKGHDYPSITLSVILDADQALFSSAYRASEGLVQTAIQVSGRAGRGEIRGEAFLQTGFPEHPLMQGLTQSSYRDMSETILAERKMLGFPPFARVVLFRADGRSLNQALEKLAEIKKRLLDSNLPDGVSCIGPMPALMTRRIGRYRAQLCLMSSDNRQLRNLLRLAMPKIESVASTQAVKWVVDVDAPDL